MIFVAVLLLAVSSAVAQQPPAAGLSGADKRMFDSVFNNKLAGVKTSIGAGANVDVRNEWEMTAIDLAVDKGYFDIAHYLLSVRNRKREEAAAQSQAPQPPPPPAGVPLPAPIEPVVTVESPLEAEVVVFEAVPPAESPSGQPSPFDPDAVSPSEQLPIIGEVREPDSGVEQPETAAITEQTRPPETAPPAPEAAETAALTGAPPPPPEPPRPAVTPAEPAVPEVPGEKEEPSAVDRLFNKLGEFLGPDGETPDQAGAPPPPPRMGKPGDSGGRAPDAAEAVDGAAGDSGEESGAAEQFLNRLGNLFGTDSPESPPEPSVESPVETPMPPADPPAPEVAREATPEVTPEVVAPEVTPEVVAPEVTPEVTPEVAQEVAPEAPEEPGAAARLLDRLSNLFGNEEPEPPTPESRVEAAPEPPETPETPPKAAGELTDETTPEALASVAGEATEPEATGETAPATETAEPETAETTPATETVEPETAETTPATETVEPETAETAEPAVAEAVSGEPAEPGAEEAFTYEAVEAEPAEIMIESGIGTEVAEIPPEPAAEAETPPDPFATPPEEAAAPDPYANIPTDTEAPDPFASIDAEPEQPLSEETPPGEATESMEPEITGETASEEPTELEELTPSEAEEPSELSELDSLAETVDDPADGESGESGGLSELDALSEDVGEGEANQGENSDWTVKDLQTAQVPRPVPAKPAITKPSGVPLQGHHLTLGKRMQLGHDLRPEKLEAGSGTPCVQKKKGTIVFCVEEVRWPEEMAVHFLVNSIMYQGAKAIVRYDEGHATYYHALFVTDSFNAILNYYVNRYGQPTETWIRRIAPLAAPRQPNPTVVWRSVEPVTKLTTHLEIRKFDDTRGGFPDTRRGAILLYHTWSTPIFPQLSNLELMLAK